MIQFATNFCSFPLPFSNLCSFFRLFFSLLPSLSSLASFPLCSCIHPTVWMTVGAQSDDLVTSCLHLSLSSDSLTASLSFRPVHCGMTSSHLFIPPATAPYSTVLTSLLLPFFIHIPSSFGPLSQNVGFFSRVVLLSLHIPPFAQNFASLRVLNAPSHCSANI